MKTGNYTAVVATSQDGSLQQYRFASMTESEIEELIFEKDAKNTRIMISIFNRYNKTNTTWFLSGK